MDWAALTDTGPYLLFFAVLLGISGFFSGTEVAMFSLRRVDREQLARSDRAVDGLVHKLLSRPRTLIATVLIGNELVNVTMSATMAIVAARVFTDYGDIEVAIFTTLVVLPFVLLLGEITPKTVAMAAPIAWSRKAARPLALFSVVISPIRMVVRAIAQQVLRPFGADSRPSPAPGPICEDELRTLVDAAGGEVNQRERQFIGKVFDFGDKQVLEVMKSAQESFLLSYDLPMERVIAEISARGYSRVPIYEKSRGNIHGVLHAKSLVLQGTGLAGQRELQELLYPPVFVPMVMPLKRLFRLFKERRVHMGIVVDEYGGFAGIVTMEDLLEELVGPINDEKENPTRLRERAADAEEAPP